MQQQTLSHVRIQKKQFVERARHQKIAKFHAFTDGTEKSDKLSAPDVVMEGNG